MVSRARGTWLLIVLLISPCFGDLKSYVEKPDDSYAYQIVKQEKVGTSDTQMIRLTSQTWNEKPWQHWMYLITPDNIQHPGKAVLLIVGGSNRNMDVIPKLPKKAILIVNTCKQLGVPVAVVAQVPNQPLFGKLKEDNLLAHTMSQYFESGNEEQIAHLPMVKSVVRAMDCVSDIFVAQGKKPITEFVLSGASKRGWTTYLTAAVDQRVIAAAPMVIDMLNLSEQMHRQKEIYGKSLSPKITPYTSRGVTEKFDTERGKLLVKLIDPYAYRHLLTMPKLLLLGTNDPFWTVDAANLYFRDLPGITYLSYTPNAGHNLNLSILPTLLNFIKAAVSQTQLANFRWEQNDDGSTTVNWQDEKARMMLWQASNPTMDFRKATWTPSFVHGKKTATVKPEKPIEGYLAYFVQATFPSTNNLPYTLSTQMTVLSAPKVDAGS